MLSLRKLGTSQERQLVAFVSHVKQFVSHRRHFLGDVELYWFKSQFSEQILPLRNFGYAHERHCVAVISHDKQLASQS